MMKAEQKQMVWMEFYLAAVKCCEEDHIGSTTQITNKSGEVVQRVEYLPTGETFIEQQDTSWVSPHKFNGKELDEETGLYYYGARYYDPRLSMWLGTDPMQGKYPGLSTYCYTMGNPIRLIDPDGRIVIAPAKEDREQLLMWINSIASDTYGFSETGFLYKVMSGKPYYSNYYNTNKYSSTYSFYLDEAIKGENTAYLLIGNSVIVDSEKHDVDSRFGGGVSILNNQTKTSHTYVSGNPYDRVLAKNQSETSFIFGESFGERHLVPPYRGYYLNDNPDMILCHEFVSHIGPWMILENSKNGIENENIVRMEIGRDLRYINLNHDKYDFNSAIFTTDAN